MVAGFGYRVTAEPKTPRETLKEILKIQLMKDAKERFEVPINQSEFEKAKDFLLLIFKSFKENPPTKNELNDLSKLAVLYGRYARQKAEKTDFDAAGQAYELAFVIDKARVRYLDNIHEAERADERAEKWLAEAGKLKVKMALNSFQTP
ncbi:MAG: hypothetical protein AB1468_02170 [Candidatus Micrarchaeota archaeon]